MSSQVINNLLTRYLEAKPPKVSGELIKVNAVISKVAFVYEKIRNAVDYNEDHLIRKLAIYRILKRQLVLEKIVFENYLLDKFHQDNVAEHLLQELIRGRYLDEKVPISMIKVVDDIIRKYNQLFTLIKDQTGNLGAATFDYYLQIAAVEIEAALIPSTKEAAIIRAMFSVINTRIQVPKGIEFDEKSKEMQVYLAAHRALYKVDDHMLRYLLLTLYYPNWSTADTEMIETVARGDNELRQEIEKQINHPWRKSMLQLVQKQSIVFWIIQDLIEKHGDKAYDKFANEQDLKTEIEKACERRYKEVGAKLRRGVIRSIIYVFFTKMILALALELPMDIYITGYYNFMTLAVNILFPPCLMLLVGLMIRMPKKENTDRIVEEIKAIASSSDGGKKLPLKGLKKRGPVAMGVFHIIYTATFVFSLMVIFWMLNKFDFNVFSSLIFVLFLTLVSFFAIRIRRPVKELIIIERRESFLSSVIDFFSLPFVSMGRWLSVEFSKINVLIFLLDFIIEAPFKLLIQIIEELFSFIKERKDDVMSE